jgi:hypothetical protein
MGEVSHSNCPTMARKATTKNPVKVGVEVFASFFHSSLVPNNSPTYKKSETMRYSCQRAVDDVVDYFCLVGACLLILLRI